MEKREAQRQRGRADNRQTTKFGESCDVSTVYNVCIHRKRERVSKQARQRTLKLRHDSSVRSINSYYNLVVVDVVVLLFVLFLVRTPLLSLMYFNVSNPIYLNKSWQLSAKSSKSAQNFSDPTTGRTDFFLFLFFC